MKLLHSLTLAGSAFARSVEMRLRLFAAELEYERLRMIRSLLLCFIGSAALGTGLISGTALLLYLIDQEYHVPLLIAATASLLLAGIGCLAGALFLGAGGRPPFADSSKALKEDFECLASLNKY